MLANVDAHYGIVCMCYVEKYIYLQVINFVLLHKIHCDALFVN